MPRAFKVYPKHPAVTFLVHLHADLGGEIKANRQEGERLSANTKHVEAVSHDDGPFFLGLDGRDRPAGNRVRGHLNQSAFPRGYAN
jgi:hypothetical protein